MRRAPIALTLALLFAGCSLLPSAAYDPVFDAALVDFQTDSRAFFDQVAAGSGTGPGAYSAFSDDYHTFSERLAGLRAMAAQHQRNESTLQSIDLLQQNFTRIEAVHRDGLVREEVELLRAVIDTQVRLLIQLERDKRGAKPEVAS